MAGLGIPELLIILAVVIVLFGVGRISKIGGELGKGIKAFREGVQEGKEKDPENTENNEEVEAEAKSNIG
ncbi:MAG: twin-arginine translocase TatA/TatE family subunit [Chloroflexi bacterium]|nr:twin-arginine translocase TatA/TatE family subunit [Chloroflexota bacterium]